MTLSIQYSTQEKFLSLLLSLLKIFIHVRRPLEDILHKYIAQYTISHFFIIYFRKECASPFSPWPSISVCKKVNLKRTRAENIFQQPEEISRLTQKGNFFFFGMVFRKTILFLEITQDALGRWIRIRHSNKQDSMIKI